MKRKKNDEQNALINWSYLAKTVENYFASINFCFICLCIYIWNEKNEML